MSDKLRGASKMWLEHKRQELKQEKLKQNSIYGSVLMAYKEPDDVEWDELYFLGSDEPEYFPHSVDPDMPQGAIRHDPSGEMWRFDGTYLRPLNVKRPEPKPRTMRLFGVDVPTIPWRRPEPDEDIEIPDPFDHSLNSIILRRRAESDRCVRCRDSVHPDDEGCIEGTDKSLYCSIACYNEEMNS